MRNIEIKEEYLPTRCEVCHQSDCFDPVNNHCSRCGSIYYPISKLVPSIQPDQYFTFNWKFVISLKIIITITLLPIGFLGSSLAMANAFHNPLYVWLAIILSIVYLGLLSLINPIIGGNRYICSKLKNFNSSVSGNYIVQISGTPRLIQNNTERELDNADDYGILEIKENYLLFTGERYLLEMPFNNIATLTRTDIAGQFWFTGDSIKIVFHNPINKLTSVIISTRMGNTVFSCHKISEEFCNKLTGLGIK